ncbi:hypothetical protein Avbf_08495 [Armadillidium vulgare]|nr:hypothetical protein Avbf_08495 [Armadillidium vulgare]
MNQQSETEFKLTFENVVRQNMNELEYSLQHFSDIYNLNSYLRSIPQMVYPVGYTLDKTSSMNSIQYVPILKTLATLLNHDEVLNEVLLCHHSEFSDIQDFCDSRNYSENLLFSHNPTALQIQLYYDDITLGNALGSRVKQSKMAMFYFSLGNIRPKYRSALHTIQLVLICNASLIKNHLSEVLLPFLTDIKTLETEGIKVIKNNVIHCFKGTVSFISADNLAAHALGRFDSFNSHRACRKCLITKVERNIVLHEDDCTLRTRVAYERQSRDANAKLYGLIGCSPFKDLRYFNIIDGLPFDIAHDWFEGIIPYVLNEFICFAVKSKWFTLKYFNERILNLQYSKPDITNKPSVMSEDIHNFKVKQTASQAWCLLRVFPFLIGHKVPINDRKWDTILILIDIIQYLCMRRVNVVNSIHLSNLIESFLKIYIEEFPNGKFTPKFHHAIHFPNQLLKFGPSLLHSTIRYEGKHLTFKEMYQSSKNKKNISYSLAVRHGILQCALLNADKYLIKNIETTNGRLINLNLLPENCQNALSLHSEGNMLVFSASKITSKNGITFNVGCALITEFYDDICRHFNSYAVEALDNYYVCSSADIINTDELGLYKCYEGNKNYHLITLKYLPAECKSVENILEKEQSVYPDARIMATYNNKHISFQINDSVTLSGFHDIIKKNFEISPTEDIELYIFDDDFKEYVLLVNMATIQNLQKIEVKKKIFETFVSTGTTGAGNFRTLLETPSCSSSWICKFTLPDFGIVTNKLSRSLAVTRSDETTIVRSIFTEVQKFTL